MPDRLLQGGKFRMIPNGYYRILITVLKSIRLRTKRIDGSAEYAMMEQARFAIRADLARP